MTRNVIVLVEGWADLSTYWDEVLDRDYFRRYLARSEAMYAKPREVTRLRPLHDGESAGTVRGGRSPA